MESLDYQIIFGLMLGIFIITGILDIFKNL